MKTRKEDSEKSDRTAVGVKISHILRQARINKHYSLDDLHRITKIKVIYLKDIDSGEFKKLPEGFYLRAFIKKYADVVGLDGTELLKRFNNELPDLQDPHYMDKVSEDKLLVRAAKQHVQNQHSAIRRYIPLFVMIIVVFAVLVGIWVIASQNHSNLTSNYHDHSTSVSGESSVKRVKHKTRKHRSRKPRVIFHHATKHGNNLTYQITSRIHPLHLEFESPAQVQLTVKDNRKTLDQMSLKPNHKRSVKLSKRDHLVQLNLDPQTKATIKMKLNHKVKQLNHKRSAQSIVLKFSK